MMKTKNFIKPQYNNSINTQHCGRLPEKTNVHHAGHLTKKTQTLTHTEKEITYEHKTTNKERKDSEITQYEITQYDCDAVSNTMTSYQDSHSENKLVRLMADTVCGAANVNKTKDTTHPQG